MVWSCEASVESPPRRARGCEGKDIRNKRGIECRQDRSEARLLPSSPLRFEHSKPINTAPINTASPEIFHHNADSVTRCCRRGTGEDHPAEGTVRRGPLFQRRWDFLVRFWVRGHPFWSSWRRSWWLRRPLGATGIDSFTVHSPWWWKVGRRCRGG